ncbi:MAG TPA: alpha-L-arabinofuranosidase C-terminal domain-containing protein [Candidatus Limnocylindria bacterium]|nr:alpha-L-arabinofuranosidase C-terminal domain-containing protein [Candidatus Limnocylindria bacterium]
MGAMRAAVDVRKKGPRIDRHVYGHFSEHLGRCIYGGYWAGEDSPIPNVRGIRTDIVEAMRAIRVPNIRWPGGCFADEYHWMDGIGPKERRVPMVNVHWGGVVEDNHFGTHEFMDLCEQVGCEPYICGNVGSGTVREMRDWVEYLTDDRASPMAQLRRQNGRDKPWTIKMFGVGTENWGCGGFMSATQYAQEYRRYATYVRDYPNMGKANWWQMPGIMKIAGGENAENFAWTETLMRDIPLRLLGGLSLHCYVKPGAESAGVGFSDESWYQTAANTLAKEPLFRRNLDIMDRYDPEKRVAMAVDEWGIWVDNEPGTPPGFLYQQNTMRSALCAVLMLHMFHRHADRIRIANLAQTVNVLQAILLTEGEKMVKTPTYHVFDLLQGHQDADFVPAAWEGAPREARAGIPRADLSASMKGDTLTVSLVNLSAEKEADVAIELLGARPLSARGRVMRGRPADHNTFAQPDRVAVVPLDAALRDGAVSVTLPPCAIASVEIQAG